MIDQFGQAAAVANRLLAAEFADIGVGLALQPQFGVPAGLSMPYEIAERGHAPACRCDLPVNP
jgi:hypothetical protein